METYCKTSYNQSCFEQEILLAYSPSCKSYLTTARDFNRIVARVANTWRTTNTPSSTSRENISTSQLEPRRCLSQVPPHQASRAASSLRPTPLVTLSLLRPWPDTTKSRFSRGQVRAKTCPARRTGIAHARCACTCTHIERGRSMRTIIDGSARNCVRIERTQKSFPGGGWAWSWLWLYHPSPWVVSHCREKQPLLSSHLEYYHHDA